MWNSSALNSGPLGARGANRLTPISAPVSITPDVGAGSPIANKATFGGAEPVLIASVAAKRNQIGYGSVDLVCGIQAQTRIGRVAESGFSVETNVFTAALSISFSVKVPESRRWDVSFGSRKWDIELPSRIFTV